MESPARRVLVVDDNPAVLADFERMLGSFGELDPELSALEAELFSADAYEGRFDLTLATQGEEAIDAVSAAMHRGTPFHIAFVDMRMPPGMDGVETVQRLWQLDPELDVVLCTAFAGQPWDETLSRLSGHDRVFVLRKPVDPIEVRQMCRVVTHRMSARSRAGGGARDGKGPSLAPRVHSAGAVAALGALADAGWSWRLPVAPVAPCPDHDEDGPASGLRQALFSVLEHLIASLRSQGISTTELRPKWIRDAQGAALEVRLVPVQGAPRADLSGITGAMERATAIIAETGFGELNWGADERGVRIQCRITDFMANEREAA